MLSKIIRDFIKVIALLYNLLLHYALKISITLAKKNHLCKKYEYQNSDVTVVKIIRFRVI